MSNYLDTTVSADKIRSTVEKLREEQEAKVDRREEFPNLRVLDHPLIQHKLTCMRDKKTPKMIFSMLLKEIVTHPVYTKPTARRISF